MAIRCSSILASVGGYEGADRRRVPGFSLFVRTEPNVCGSPIIGDETGTSRRHYDSRLRAWARKNVNRRGVPTPIGMLSY